MKVFIVGGDNLVAKLFGTIIPHVQLVENLKAEPDMVVFTGGADVSPSYYGEMNVKSSCDPARDRKEFSLLQEIPDNIPKVGICRGGQLLNIFNKGKMFQHVDNHTQTHKVILCRRPEFKIDYNNVTSLEVTSTHHQMMRPGKGATLLAFANICRHRLSDSEDFITNNYLDPEVYYYAATKTLCFQPHPEYSHTPTRDLFKYYLEKLDLVKEPT